VTILAVYLFRQLIIVTMGVPFLFPSPGLLLAQVAGGLALTLLSVTLAPLCRPTGSAIRSRRRP